MQAAAVLQISKPFNGSASQTDTAASHSRQAATTSLAQAPALAAACPGQHTRQSLMTGRPATACRCVRAPRRCGMLRAGLSHGVTLRPPGTPALHPPVTPAAASSRPAKQAGAGRMCSHDDSASPAIAPNFCRRCQPLHMCCWDPDSKASKRTLSLSHLGHSSPIRHLWPDGL